MKIIRSITAFNSSEKTIVTIGTFDGIHIGHQKILKDLIKTAKKEGKKSVLLTFFPHPRMVLQKDNKILLLNTIEEKSGLLEKMGLDYLIIHPFSKEFSRLTALDFVRDILVNKLNTSRLIIGYDHHFGKNREGNIHQLKEYSLLYDFKVEEIPAQDIDDVSVSSTKIRTALKEGNLKTANNYLGYHYMINGTVVSGKKLGGTIGFPTANLEIKEPYKLIPKTGVYIIKTHINTVLYTGIMNIGFNPTVLGKHQTIEAHLFDFNEDLYGKEIMIEFIYFLREEHKFKSVKELVVQLNIDKENAISYLSNNPL
ncbi:MAG: bifunctional riboflavin kinase/FAD synthetase [Flavobacterium sp.]|nr:bifunctional riboflavin kinase/FAD synthetase [Flavobacterium sp.]MBT6377720.1 bifunctional riboflavin kinase/FAD synthetase [Flavobacterium sp.]MBT6881045.1 bifunctional riboflavin kinase/FAD synthetase [Flavobacterium sp.]MBT7425072.1 bifunctional riboflavin kinase/FAD synthetase [Flavobacterium sp.]